MKKFVVFLFVIISFVCFSQNLSFASSAKQESLISKIENEIYGFDYNNDSSQNRVARLEKTIYGKSFTGDINKRVHKLSADISADVIGLEIPPTEDTFKEDETVADSSVNYPIVDEIEQKIFNQTYKNRDFHSRIVAIERKLFGKIYDVDDYSTRMDRIKISTMISLQGNITIIMRLILRIYQELAEVVLRCLLVREIILAHMQITAI